MLNFEHMTLEVRGEGALPMPVTEDPLVLRRSVLSRHARSSVENHGRRPRGASGIVVPGNAVPADLLAGCWP
ncbi:MAG TPA: hypothetical protein VN461_24010 [Vicinamibacteria bacterium]|jgi:hypothetical protein|nr:hypothetical protein [Vicinamibacteria bacterium]